MKGLNHKRKNYRLLLTMIMLNYQYCINGWERKEKDTSIKLKNNLLFVTINMKIFFVYKTVL